jgi:hypothetical protein
MAFWRFARRGLLLAALTALLLPAAALAQEDPDAEFEAGNWDNQLTIGANLLQSYYTDNWNGGDKGSIVWNATLEALARKRLGDAWHWRNTASLAFGQNHQQERRDDGSLAWGRPDKTDDLIEAESLLRYTRSPLAPYFSLGFESQFLDQTDPDGRDLSLNPLIFSQSLGISRMLVENEERTLLARLGFTLQESVRELYLAAPPDDATSTESAVDGGLELVLDYDAKLLGGRVDYASEIRIYQPLFYSGKSDVDDLAAEALTDAGLDADLGDYFLTTDIDVTNTFKASITEVINVQLHLRWVYDKYDNTVVPVVEEGAVSNPGAVAAAVRKTGQFKQTMSLGLGYTF